MTRSERTAEGPTVAKAAYLVGDAATAAAITRSLQALLPTRHREIPRHRLTILDTFDGRVRRAGAQLTRESENGSTRLSWEQVADGREVALRLEKPVNFAWDLPDGPLQQALAPIIGVRRLLAQADTEGCGSLLDVLDARGKTVARLRIESGRARLPLSGIQWQPVPTVITLTGLRGYESKYRELLPILESRPGLEPCPDGFVGATLRRVGAFAHAGLSSPRPELPADIPAAAGIRQIHLALLDVLVANEHGLCANLDTEFLHDFRIAVRRVRSLLGQIREVLPAAAVDHFGAEFGWICRLTGPPRDLDVLILALRAYRGEVSAGDLEAVTAFLDREQQREHARLVEALDSRRYRRLLTEWRGYLKTPSAMTDPLANADRPLADVVAERAWRLSRRISRAASSLDDQTSAEQLHDLRLDAKKLRYLVDVSAPLFEADDLRRLLGALKRLQRRLGDFNDADVQERRLLAYGGAVGTADVEPATLMTVGRLAAECAQRRQRLRGRLAEGFERFLAKDVKAARQRLFKPRSAGGSQ